MNWLGSLIIAFVLAWTGAQNAHAVKLPALSGGAAVATGGKSSTVAVGGAGNTAVRSPTPGSELGRVLGNRPYSVAGAEGAEEFARLQQKGRVPVAEKEVPAEILSPVGKEAIVGGAVGLITGGVAGAVIGAGTPLLLDWMNRAGVRQNPETGAPETSDPEVCTVAPCYDYQVQSSVDGQYPAWSFTKSNALRNYEELWNSLPSNANQQARDCAMISDSTAKCIYGSDNGNYGYVALAKRSAPPRSPTWYPSTPQAIRDRLYNTSKPDVAVIKEILEKGGDVALGPTSVTGPAELKGDKRTRTLPDGSKVEDQDYTRYGYDGGKVTELGRRTVTTNISPTGERTPAGETETLPGESDPTGTPAPSEESGSQDQPEPPPTDTPLPPVPDLYTRKYPQGMEGIYDEYKDQLKNTSLVQLAKQLMPNIGDGGTCPSWPINLNFATWAPYGVHDVAPPCWIWDVAKAILILSALLLARALIFGG
ncbi:hypothetical protein J2W39_004934 [Variovorax paradoxus]|uniref:Neisseria meningitidis TspB protein n=1 Tax=Variovorax paradoxus TaxID=34073 RepID=A0AAW8EMP2_VARPD|nr:hypothetical protein [Variovorax paradoxus]MDP9973675.1 hypothetical protein [Variovorax paradoxus]